MTQVLLTVTIPTVTVLVGILISNARLTDMSMRIQDLNMRISELRVHFDTRIDDVRDSLRAEMRRIEEVMDARLKHLEERIR